MNETVKNIIERRSVKKYLAKPVEKELIDCVLKAGTYAPTGRNRQPVKILAITDPEVREELRKLNAAVMGMDDGIDPFYGAPVVLIVLADKSVPTYIYDGSLVMGNLLGAAHAVGLGACWIHRAKETFESDEGKAILRELGIEGDYEGIGNCILGYIDGDIPATRPRKDGYIIKA